MSGNSISDSSAVLLQRVLPHQQEALSALHSILANYQSNDPFDWLDVACGRGQMITHLDDALPADERAKIHYFGYDINNEYVREAEGLGRRFGLKGTTPIIGHLNDFARLVSPEKKFSFITFTNAIHELPPSIFGALFLELFLRLKPGGTIFIYDMETLPELELGAIPWKTAEVHRLLSFIFKAAGANNKPPAPQRWRLTKCSTWSVRIRREDLDLDDATFAVRFSEIRTKTDEFVKNLFQQKLTGTTEQLQSLMESGGKETTPEEHKEKLNLLSDYWSLTRFR